MRRLLAWLACMGGAAFVLSRRLRRRPAAEPAADPTQELKRKLEESRTAPSPGPSAGPEEGGLDERRRAVHERARASIDEMRGDRELDGDHEREDR
jgi:hypothetical protein